MRCAEAPRCGFPSGLGVEGSKPTKPHTPYTVTWNTQYLEPRLAAPASVGNPFLLLQQASTHWRLHGTWGVPHGAAPVLGKLSAVTEAMHPGTCILAGREPEWMGRR
jgi:hypothetical protein